MTELIATGEHAPISRDYLDTLLRYYQEEISGEAYFYSLVGAFGESEVSSHQGSSWKQFMTYIVERYPLYLDEFYALETMAPPEDLPFVQALTEHEIVVIEFAERELAGEPDSAQPLKLYLSQPGAKRACVT